MGNRIPKPRIVAFEITQKCPLNCLHCRAGNSQTTPDRLSTEQCKNILKSLADFNRCVVILTGGEPMTRVDVYDLIEYGTSLGLRMVMATCGYYINNESKKKLKFAGLLSISFSLDGADAVTHDNFRRSPGTFERTIAAIKIVHDAGIRFQINTTITKHNINQLHDIERLAVNLGAACFNPFILVPVGRAEQIKNMTVSPDEYEQLLIDLADLSESSSIEVRVTCGPQYARIARQRKIKNSDKIPGCLAATDFVFISAKGSVQTCGFLPISAGNLIDNGYDFADIWLNSPLLNEIRDHLKYKKPCSGCAYLDYCRGCRARAFAESGDFLQADPICIITRNFNRKQGK